MPAVTSYTFEASGKRSWLSLFLGDVMLDCRNCGDEEMSYTLYGGEYSVFKTLNILYLLIKFNIKQSTNLLLRKIKNYRGAIKTFICKTHNFAGLAINVFCALRSLFGRLSVSESGGSSHALY